MGIPLPQEKGKTHVHGAHMRKVVMVIRALARSFGEPFKKWKKWKRSISCTCVPGKYFGQLKLSTVLQKSRPSKWRLRRFWPEHWLNVAAITFARPLNLSLFNLLLSFYCYCVAKESSLALSCTNHVNRIKSNFTPWFPVCPLYFFISSLAHVWV